MCLILIALDNPNAKTLLEKFMSKSTPYDLRHGYGILHKNNKEWISSKTTEPPFVDKQYKTLTNHSNIIVQLRRIYTFNVDCHHIENEHTIVNTQPYVYKNMHFMHQGNLLVPESGTIRKFQMYYKTPSFQSKINKLMTIIDADLSKHIHGNTDSELWFYLFVHNLLKNKSHKLSRDQLANAFINSIHDIESAGFQNNSNIVFTHENYVMFANIYRTDHIFSTIYGTGERIHMDVANLYADVNEGLSVCSTRLNPSYQKIKQNKIYIYNLLSKKLSEHDIPAK